MRVSVMGTRGFGMSTAWGSGKAAAPTRFRHRTANAADFEYFPLVASMMDRESDPFDFVVATYRAVRPRRFALALRRLVPDVSISLVIACNPIYWTRIRAAGSANRIQVLQALEKAAIPLRYVASALRGCVALPKAPLVFAKDTQTQGAEWPTKAPMPVSETRTAGKWFLYSKCGIHLDRALCGTGAGTRLAIIDDDAAEAERLGLEREVLVNVDKPPRAQSHGSLLAARAAAAREQARIFRGVAPDTSVRLYAIPKPGNDVLSLPEAIMRAANDGADVVLCATYVEGSTCPMLDDALEFATRLGRGGRGTAVVMPTGREASSPPTSLHSSWSLGFGEPASDPRVFCIAPSSRQGGWFLWRDRKGRLRPFANRGANVRWMAPGDDLSHPFVWPERLTHAESSGAAAVAAGVLLLALGQSPELRLSELESIVTQSVLPAPPNDVETIPDLADPYDVLPWGIDRDSHNAKYGYGRMDASHACLCVLDPVCASLVAMGEDRAAAAFWKARRLVLPIHQAYSERLGRFMARGLASQPSTAHALRALLRHLRLVAGRRDRFEAHALGAILRHMILIIRDFLLLEGQLAPDAEIRTQLNAVLDWLSSVGCEGPDSVRAFEQSVWNVATWLFALRAPVSRRIARDSDNDSETNRFLLSKDAQR